MLKRLNFNTLLLLLIMISAISCSKFRKIQKSGDWEMKYRAAIEYYETEDYYKAALLFEEILPIIRGRPEAEKVQYYFAYSYYHQKQYVLSAHYFETFYQLYARSEYAEEAMFMYAYSLYLDSPDISLDQTSTTDAIQAIQTFLNRFPRSKFRQQASQIIDELQVKLENKAYETAIQYYRLEKYNGGDALKAALIAFENYQNDFPDSKRVEDICYLKIECSYKMAKKSIKSRQRERLEKTVEYYLYFIDNYPLSSFVKAAESIYLNCLDDIKELNQNNL